ncbi:MAG: hypothetical protein R3C10_19700 [Pirellulales bacterium]
MWLCNSAVPLDTRPKRDLVRWTGGFRWANAARALATASLLLGTVWCSAVAHGQEIRRGANPQGADPVARQADARSAAAAGALAPVTTTRRSVAQVTTKPPHLTTDAGQTWREYDIRPYTARVSGEANPQQPIVDWILQETGDEIWHSGPMGFFHADERTLTVFHTDEVQRQVAGIVDRFVNSQTESHVFGMRVVTLRTPNWRSKAQGMLQPVPVQTPGAQAWLMHKENMALLVSELRRRTDFREHTSSHLTAANGRPTIVSTMHQRPYVRDILVRPGTYPGFEVASATVDEGLEIELTPLMSLDEQMIDAVIDCRVAQVEKVNGVTLEMPAGTAGASRQKTQIEVPQMVQYQMKERFRWPSDQVLVLALGVVPAPISAEGATLFGAIPLPSSPPRAEVVLFVGSKGQQDEPSTTGGADSRAASLYRDRY